MDFYVDLAVAVLLRLIKDRRGVVKYYPALAKVYAAIQKLSSLDGKLADEINKQVQP
jgi:hypothetical protein